MYILTKTKSAIAVAIFASLTACGGSSGVDDAIDGIDGAIDDVVEADNPLDPLDDDPIVDEELPIDDAVDADNPLDDDPIVDEELPIDDGPAESDPSTLDSDNDGVTDQLDCAPNDASIFPGAVENPTDGIDSDCDGTVENLNPVVDGIEFVNVANGAVTEITDLEDSMQAAVVQTVPVLDDGVPSSVDTPITLFFNDKLFLDSLFNNIIVLQNGVQVTGTVSITENAAGFAILTFIPDESYEDGSTVTLTLNGGENGVLDDGGNTLVSNSGDNFVIALTTIDTNVQAFDDNLSFEENVNDGVVFTGDGAILSGPLGCLVASEGTNYAAITTGNAIVSDGFAVGNTSSTMQLGPIALAEDQSSISFDFNFVSNEFNEFVGSQFDDSAVVSITGPDGNTECLGIESLVLEVDDEFGDDFAGQIGWISEAINVSELGSPIFITFSVTDVADDNLSSILAIDNIQL